MAMQNKLGEEDAISEKGENLETSSSEGGSGSSCQDLSENEHEGILAGVLNQLRPYKPGSRLSHHDSTIKLAKNQSAIEVTVETTPI